MSQTIITLAFEQWKAQQAVSGAPVLLDGFVLANVPGLDPAAPINRSEGLPPAAQIVHRQDVSQAGVINENAVAYSVTLGADVGDFAFNWIGLINKATNTVAMIVHAPVQQKVKNAAGQQGNVLTRSFVMEYNGAQAETQITTPAETWQIDFTARLGGVDERQRVENVDIYGAAAFFDNGYLVTKSGSSYSIAPGVGYVAGLRTQLAASQPLTVTTKPVKVWLDVCFKGTLTSVWGVETAIKVAVTLADYVADGRQHYVFAVASIDAAGTVTDLRPKGSLADQSGASAYARKDRNLSDLDNIPKAREALKLKGAALLDVGAAAGMVAAGDDSRIVNAVPNKRKINGHPLTDDFDITASDVKALAVTSVRALPNPSAGNVGNANDLPTNSVSFVYSTAPNSPELTGTLLDFAGGANDYNIQLAASYSGGSKFKFRTKNGDPSSKVWNPWYEFYHTGNKPTASDVNAIPDGLSGSGTNAPAWNAKSGLYLLQMDGSSQMVVHLCSGVGSTRALQIKADYRNRSISYRSSRDGFGFESDWSDFYTTTNKPSAADVGALSTGGGAMTGAITGVYKESSSWADQYSTKAPFYDDYTSTAGSAYRPVIKQRATTTGNSWAFSMGTLVSGGALSWHLHIRGSSGLDINHRWATDGNYYAPNQVIPANYANLDARYLVKSSAVQGVRLSGRTYIGGRGGTLRAPAGCVFTAIGDFGADDGYGEYSALQVNINGTWATVSGP